MEPNVLGGWQVVLTCDCGSTETVDAVIPGLLPGKVDRAGWDSDLGLITDPRSRRDGTCAWCRRDAA